MLKESSGTKFWKQNDFMKIKYAKLGFGSHFA